MSCFKIIKRKYFRTGGKKIVKIIDIHGNPHS